MTTEPTFEGKLAILEARIAQLESTSAKSPKVKVPKVKRLPSKYNEYIGKEIKRIKELNPEIKHSDAFKQATVEWSKLKKTTDEEVKN